LLTVDFERLDVGSGARVLDVGCGTGRHCFEALRRGCTVVGLDLAERDLRQANDWMAAMHAAGESRSSGSVVRGDALHVPFPDETFDALVISEVLEHIHADSLALSEAARVLKAGGRLAVTVPRWLPERICWALSTDYHSNPGGHVRIYRGGELLARVQDAGFELEASAHAHAIHSPYWWLRCLLGERSAVCQAYHRLLVWDIERRPRVLRRLERLLNPVFGKSLVLYFRRREAGDLARAA
jgi:SAM-dependent methyltransferase